MYSDTFPYAESVRTPLNGFSNKLRKTERFEVGLPIKMFDSKPIFRYFRLFKGTEKKISIKLPTTGFEPMSYGIDNDRSADRPTTTDPNVGVNR